MANLQGKQLGNYTIIEQIGEGGMGQVYRAHQVSIERDVALKILPDDLTKDPNFLKRFKKEAKVIAKLQHPHILSVHDFGEHDGYTYLVMPLMSGGTLGDLIQGKPLDLKDIRRIVSQVGSALHYAHERGLIHRDVKPSNILIDESGNCLLSDFGLVKELKGDVKLTESGAIMGTPTYISPEQGQGSDLDRRSDIYALGVILYEMATGQVPFTGNSPVDVVVKHISATLPSPKSLNPSLPNALIRIIEKALAKNPDERYATAAELVAEMQAAISESGKILTGIDDTATQIGTQPDLPTTVVSQQQPTRRTAYAIGFVLFIIVAGIMIAMLPKNNSSSDAISPTPLPEAAVSKICFNSDFHVEAGSFNGDMWADVQDAAAVANLETDVATIETVEISDSLLESTYRENLNNLINESGCDVMVSVGFQWTGVIVEAARSNPDIYFIHLDGSPDTPLNIPNIWEQHYLTHQAAFQAGYVAASVTKTGKVATFGGLQFSGIEDFMDGFALGVNYFNETRNKSVEVLGWDIETQTGDFMGSFDDPSLSYTITRRFIDAGADVILPVASRAGSGAAVIALQHDDVYVIGVDTDWTITYPDYEPIILTSIEKNWNLSILAALNDITTDNFTGGAHIGNISNGEVGLSPFRNSLINIPDYVRTGLALIQAEILAGNIQTRWTDDTINASSAATPSPTPETSVSKICYNADGTLLTEGSFIGDIWADVQDAATIVNIEAEVATLEVGVSPNEVETAFKANLNKLIDESGCDVIVTSGFFVISFLAEAAHTHPNIYFIHLDSTADTLLNIDNIWEQDYVTDQATFLAGYVAASVTRTGKVATFGGFQYPTVENIMDGFALGVNYYNEKNGTEVEVLGWDVETQTGAFIDSFDLASLGSQITQEFIEEGADIILPAAGYASTGAANLARQQENVYVIGIDTDWVVTYPQYESVTLTSVEKKWNLSILAALNAIAAGKFEGGLHTGNVGNGEIALSPFRNFDPLVPSRVDADLIQIKTDIMTGKIQTRSTDD